MSSSHGWRGTQGHRACLSVYLRLSREYSDAADGLSHFCQDDALGSSVPPTTDRVGATYVALLWHRFVLSSGVHSTFASSSDSHGEHPAAAPHCLTPETEEFTVRLKTMLQVW